ncbi:MAG: serine hydrolase domain-containing protein [Lachnospiraceae bacterium]
MNFEAFVKDIETNKWNVWGVEVYENGHLTYDYGDTCGNIHEIYSATKTVLSVAVGIAYDRGFINLEKSLLEYIPTEKLNQMSAEQKNSFEKITIHRLLTMSVGDLPFRPEGNSYLDFSLACNISNPDEKVFHYSNISAYLVGVALSNAIGEDLGAFIEKNIFEPLHITKYEYGRCPEGYFYGASSMKLTVHELSQIGLLLYHKGMYEGKRILSEQYVQKATSVQQMNREGGYGYFIWKYRDGFSINGKWKQKCYVLPQEKLIITYLAHIEDDSHDLLLSMEKNILGYQ